MGQSRAQWAAEAQSNRLRHLIRARTGHDPGPTLQKVLGLGRGISRPTSEAYIKGSPGGAGVGRIFNLEFPDLVGSYATGGRRYRPPKRFSFAKVGTRAVGEKVIHSQTPTPSTVRTIEGVKEIDQKLFSKKADKTQLFKSGKKRRTKF
jgi:hypothetical protein